MYMNIYEIFHFYIESAIDLFPDIPIINLYIKIDYLMLTYQQKKTA